MFLEINMKNKKNIPFESCHLFLLPGYCSWSILAPSRVAGFSARDPGATLSVSRCPNNLEDHPTNCPWLISTSCRGDSKLVYGTHIG